MIMKKILLICLTLLLVQGVCFAKIEHGADNFEGSSWYSVSFEGNYPSMNSLRSTFLVFFDHDKYDGNGFGITMDKQYGYKIGDTIKMQIDNNIYTWQTASDSIRSAFIKRSFTIPDNVYQALMQTKQPISIRFYHSSIDGDFYMDYSIPYKTIQEAQTMFKTYVPKLESTKQPAQ